MKCGPIAPPMSQEMVFLFLTSPDGMSLENSDPSESLCVDTLPLLVSQAAQDLLILTQDTHQPRRGEGMAEDMRS